MLFRLLFHSPVNFFSFWDLNNNQYRYIAVHVLSLLFSSWGYCSQNYDYYSKSC